MFDYYKIDMMMIIQYILYHIDIQKKLDTCRFEKIESYKYLIKLH